MGSVDQQLWDAIITYQLDLRRLEAGTVKGVIAILNRMQGELVATLAGAGELTSFTKARKQELLRQVNAVLNKYYATAQGELALTTEGLAQAQAVHMVNVLNGTVAVGIGAVMPPQGILNRLADNVLINGGPVADWWSRLSVDTAFRLGNEIRQGIAQGETNAQVIARVIGKNGQPGIMELSRRNAASVVHTSIQSIANDARLRTFEANSDVVLQLEWFSALDSRVCARCAALSGKSWALQDDGNHKPSGHNVPFQRPPIHFNDRCVLLPVTKLTEFIPTGTRASEDGPVSASMTFDGWLSRRTVAQQDDQLGHGRAQMWRDKKITLDQLIDGRGRELTLSELKSRYE